MSEQTPGNAEPGRDPNEDSGIIPLVPDEQGNENALRPRGAAPGLPGLADARLDTCPNCGSPLAADAVVCTKCGLDMRAGQLRRPEIGVDEVEEAPAKPEFVTPGRGSVQALLVVAGVLTLVATIMAGVNAPGQEATLKVWVAVRTVYDTLLHAGTGIIAVAIAAVLAEERFTRVGLAAARMFVAFALFQAIRVERIAGLPMWANSPLFLLLAAGAYFLAVMVLFKKHSVHAGMIMIAHLSMWAALELGIALSQYVDNQLRALPAGAWK